MVADRPGDVAGDIERPRVRLIEVPAFGDRVAVVVADHLEERAADQFVDRPAGEQRCTLVRRLDHTTVVQAHHGVGQVIEQAADLRLGSRQLADRPLEAPADPARFQHRGHDRDQSQQCDTDDDTDRVGARIGLRSHTGQHDERSGHRDDRQDQPPHAVLPFGGRQRCSESGVAVIDVAGDHRPTLEL